MPASILSLARVRAGLGMPLSDAALEELVFLSKAEWEGRDGDDLRISVTPDRLDLLSEAGLALHLAGAIGIAEGLPRPRDRPAGDSARCAVDPSVGGRRPAFAAVTVEAPDEAGLDDATLAEAIRFQELLHATVGRDRRVASLGIYPLDRIEFPLRYALEPIEAVRFVPLDGTEEIAASRFYAEHPMALRYGGLGRDGGAVLTLRDARGSVLSLPPVLNARGAGEARPGDRRLLLESTGLSARAVREALGLLEVVFVGRGWSVGPVATIGSDNVGGAALYRPRTVDLPADLLGAIAGEALPASEVAHRLAAVRLGGHPHPHGWSVEVPPWRPDLQTAVDLAEDVVLAGGIRPESGQLPPSRSRGHRLPEGRFRARVRRRLLGMGLAQPYTPLLVGEATARLAGAEEAIRLQNPVSAEFAVLRDRLLLSHLEVLQGNTRHPYPQRFGEVGPVLRRSPAAESGAETRYHAALVLAEEGAGFADGAARAELLLRSFDVGFVREPTTLPATIPGRAAVCRVAGEPVAEVAEIHPEVLVALGVPVPVTWAELDLTALWALGGRRDTH